MKAERENESHMWISKPVTSTQGLFLSLTGWLPEGQSKLHPINVVIRFDSVTMFKENRSVTHGIWRSGPNPSTQISLMGGDTEYVIESIQEIFEQCAKRMQE